jgi:L-malate glycosyltransferase
MLDPNRTNNFLIKKTTMKIGILGPMDLKAINLQDVEEDLPEVYSFPLISHLINGIVDSGHEVIAFTTSSRIDESLVINSSNNVTICIAKAYGRPGRRFFKEEIENLTTLIKSNPPDIIHAHWTYEFAWAAMRSGLPHVVTIHDVAAVILRNKFDPYRLVRWYLNWVTMNNATHFIANSHYTYNVMSKKVKKRTTIINNFYPNGLEKVRLANKENYFITVSNAFDRRKNIAASLQAFSILRSHFPGMTYYLVGSVMGHGGEAYQYAVKNNLHHDVKFLGGKSHDEIIELIKCAKLMIHPATEESFGMVVLESMIVGTPVIGGSESGNIPFLLKQEETGLLCKITEPEQIANAAIKLLNDVGLYTKIQNNAKKYALQEFSEHVSILRHVELYKKILKEENKVEIKKNVKIKNTLN